MKEDHNRKSRDLLDRIIYREKGKNTAGQQHLNESERELVKFNFNGKNQKA